ncbi:hypothetical protein V8B97DRAFT_1876514, partial [Scleroderma yunnanense]
QTLHALLPSPSCPHGLYDAVVINADEWSDWLSLVGHSVVQLQVIFHPVHSEQFMAYVQCFNIVPQQGTVNHVNPVMGMHLLQCAVRSDGSRIGDVIPIMQIWSPAHLIPNFSKEAHPCLTNGSSYKLSTDFWLNKYWSKEFYSALSH